MNNILAYTSRIVACWFAWFAINGGLVISSDLAVSDGDASLASAAPWQWRYEEDKSVALKGPNGIVWKFNYDARQPKPYFHPIALPSGHVLTWNQPPDHNWHHGLWFSWKYINGVNYWEPSDAQAGTYAGRTQWSNTNIDRRPDHSARITMDITYRDPRDTVVLSEKRMVDISSPQVDGSYSIDWMGTFTAGAQDVELNRTPVLSEQGGRAWGGYAGLSIRFAKKLSERQASLSEGITTFESDRARPKAIGADYSGLMGSQPVGIAFLDHPGNRRYPTTWYIIRSKVMSYINAALLTHKPLTIQQGKSITLRYRLIVHNGRWDAAALQEAHKRYSLPRQFLRHLDNPGG